MLITLTASADTYITNKIIDKIYSTASNVGRAGTLDLFTIYDQSQIPNSYEKSRILINFNIDSLEELSSSILNSKNFKAYLNLKNISAGNAVPSNFNVSCFPLAKEFEEGMGRDIVSFSDYDYCNYVKANKIQDWQSQGCNTIGVVGSSNIDYYESIDSMSLESSQDFVEGTEDLFLDVTNVISSSLAKNMNFYGFRLSYSGTQDTDAVSRFVKRFGSRHVKNKSLAPKLLIKFDDVKIDFRQNMFFDITGSFRLNNRNGNLRNTDGSEITGSECVYVTLSTGSFNATFTGSQELFGINEQTSYAVDISISSNESGIVSGAMKLSDYIQISNNIIFDESWHDKNNQKIFYTGSVVFLRDSVSTSALDRCKLISRCEGPVSLDENQTFIMRVSFYDILYDEAATKFSIERQSIKPINAYYRFRDIESGELLYDFDDFAKLSLDSKGNYANISSTIFIKGRTYTPEFKLNYLGEYRMISDKNHFIKVRV